VPEDIETQRAADPTLCDSDPGVNLSPMASQTVHVATDLSILVAPAGSQFQDTNDTPGVCISTDGGKSFHHAAFAGAANGPNGVGCSSKDHCVAYADVPYGGDANAPAVFVSNDATKGAASTWTAAKTPSLQVPSWLRYVTFAADGQHGWLVGWQGGATPFLWTTADGGATWTDASSKLGVTDDFRPYSVFALDATHLWVGGEWVGGDDKVLTIAL
jgi:hypothetical protein